MITLQITAAKEKDAEEILSELLESELVYAGFVTPIKSWKRKKDKVHYNFNCLTTAFTQAVLFKEIELFLVEKFPQKDFILYAMPLLNFSGQHEQILRKETRSKLK